MSIITTSYPLTLIRDGGPPATDLAGLPGLWATAWQRNGLDVLVELGWSGQTEHGETMEGRAVGTVTDYEINLDVLLRSLGHSKILFPQRCSNAGGSARRRNRITLRSFRPQAEASL